VNCSRSVRRCRYRGPGGQGHVAGLARRRVGPSPGNTPARFDAVDLIRAKRDGSELTDQEIRWLIDAYVAGTVPDEQVAALLMAIYLRGMSLGNGTASHSPSSPPGRSWTFQGFPDRALTKHSTGGVGDKVSLVLAPLVASFGAAVPQLSGRGLGHTGGTLESSEAIPGWRSQLTTTEILDQLESVAA